jgi:tetratricopeptide (TPR) repeat protein
MIKQKTCYLKALHLAPSYSVAHNNLGNVYLRKGREFYVLAIRHFKMAIELKPTYAEACLNLGNTYPIVNDKIKMSTYLSCSLD